MLQMFLKWKLRQTQVSSEENNTSPRKTEAMSGFWCCSQGRGFWDRGFLLGRVSICKAKKAPTKFHPNPQFPSVFLAFSIFLILWIFLSLSHKSGPHYEKNETCPDFAQTWWGPSLGYYKTKLFQAGSLYLKNPGSEIILQFSPFLHFSNLHFSILWIVLSVVHFCSSNLLSYKSGPLLRNEKQTSLMFRWLV